LSGTNNATSTGVAVKVPDLGDFTDVAVIDVLVKVGDRIDVETPLVTLETDKATMDVPSSSCGVVASIAVRTGDKVATGSLLLTLAAVPADEDHTATVSALRAVEPYGGEPYVDTIPMPRFPPGATGGKVAATVPVAPPASTMASQTAAGAPAPESHPYDFDLVVLGAGPGGYTAAFRAADLGLKVALIERWPTLGGVCLNVGCIPSKALLHAARVIEEAEAMSDFGVSFGKPVVDAAKLRDWKNKVVARLTGGLAALARQRKVTVISGTAKFESPHGLTVVAGEARQTVTFSQCVVAAGSESLRLSGLPDDPRIIDSTGALELNLPARLLVVGGGIIGLEMATVYDALGVKVSVVELTEGLMPGCDRDLVRPLEKRISARYESIMLRTKMAKIEPIADGLRVTFEGEKAPEPQIYDKVLVAVGRTPNGKLLGAEAAGIVVNDRGYIPVDKQMRTNVPHVFAIGDIVGQPMLAHKATHEGKVAAEVAAGQRSFFDARVIPSVAYTDPEIAWVGLTETDAKARGFTYEKAVFPWAASGRSLAIGRDEGATKLLFDPQSHRVLGGGIVGTNAGELIAEVVLAIEMGADATDIGLAIHPHPTLSETVAMAAESFEGTLTDLYVPKRKPSQPKAG
jgi:dihydrolipoamide dehydrogenase